MRGLAAAWFRDQKPGHTLQPTALVHEAYVKLVDRPPGDGQSWSGRAQFFALAASAMRSILVDHARSRNRLKRGGGQQRVPLEQADQTPATLDEATVLAINEAMTRLEALDPRKAKLVELRFFGGMSADEAAEILGIARSTAAEDWRMARAWLSAQLQEPEG